jgi:hypothetical protein
MHTKNGKGSRRAKAVLTVTVNQVGTYTSIPSIYPKSIHIKLQKIRQHQYIDK